MDQYADQDGADSGNGLFRKLVRKSSATVDVPNKKEKVTHNTPSCSFDSRTGNPFGKKGYSGSGSNGNVSVSSGDYIGDPGSILSLQPWIFKREDADTVGAKICSVNLGCVRRRDWGTLHSSCPRQHCQKTSSYFDNCLIPHLYSENFDVEEYVFDSFSSQTKKAARPFVVTNGSNVISRSSSIPSEIASSCGLVQELNETVSKLAKPAIGIPPLTEPRKLMRKGGKLFHQRTGNLGLNRSSNLSQTHASLNGLMLFSIGIGIGMFCSSLSGQRELDILNDKLKRSENLIQDLQEELEMQECLSVKELTNEASGRNEEDDNCHPQFHKVESMSEIEAELEAELERLALNVNCDSREANLSSIGMVDQEMIGDVVCGELQAEALCHGDHLSGNEQDEDRRDCSTNGRESVSNYPVCPKDLSLRLHEVIEQRLQGRIKELQSALARSQKHLQLMEAEQRAAVSRSDMGTSSNHGSPIQNMQETISLSQAFCLNLGGDALDAYDEACEVFMQMVDSECDRQLCPEPKKKHKLPREQTPTSRLSEDDALEQDMDIDVYEFDDDDGDYDDDDGDDYESKLLIHQIVEQTKAKAQQGSSVLIQAKKLLFSLDQ